MICDAMNQERQIQHNPSYWLYIWNYSKHVPLYSLAPVLTRALATNLFVVYITVSVLLSTYKSVLTEPLLHRFPYTSIISRALECVPALPGNLRVHIYDEAES